jgi:shikimate kinase
MYLLEIDRIMGYKQNTLNIVKHIHNQDKWKLIQSMEADTLLEKVMYFEDYVDYLYNLALDEIYRYEDDKESFANKYRELYKHKHDVYYKISKFVMNKKEYNINNTMSSINKLIRFKEIYNESN